MSEAACEAQPTLGGELLVAECPAKAVHGEVDEDACEEHGDTAASISFTVRSILSLTGLGALSQPQSFT